jgi:hypothetical protein
MSVSPAGLYSLWPAGFDQCGCFNVFGNTRFYPVSGGPGDRLGAKIAADAASLDVVDATLRRFHC